jgi:hypothetical protein
MTKQKNDNDIVVVERKQFNPMLNDGNGEYVVDQISMLRKFYKETVNDPGYVKSQQFKGEACPLTLTIVEDPADKPAPKADKKKSE